MHYPLGRPTTSEPPARLGLSASARVTDSGHVRVSLESRRLAYCVRVHLPGFTPDDDAFSLEPGRERVVHLRPGRQDAVLSGGEVTALNLQGRIRFDCGRSGNLPQSPRETAG